jgi:hypothetical protein
MATDDTYPIPNPSNSGYLFPAVPVALGIGLLVVGQTSGPSYLTPIAIVPLVVAVALGYLAYAMKRVAVSFTATDVTVGAGMSRRVTPRSALVRDKARIVDLAKEPELNTALRTNGVETAGYKQGWFKLKNGEKALVALNDEHHAVYVPTTSGYVLLVSPPRPEKFLARIKE